VKTCPVCGKEYPDTTKFCPVDGSTLRAKSPTADLVGQVVADRYAIIRKLGEGGMGAVYLGEHVKMGRKSAIKVMNPGMSADPDAISRFNREAANASRISHPNVCQIYDFGETMEGVIYLAMEFIEGASLTDIIEREGALPPPRAARILRQAADALAAAHDLGIVHRDLKPDNIMIVQGKDGSDVVKVVDFGIAKAVAGDEAGQKVTKTGLVVGTPEYMSPEQLAGDKLDGRSDIYSLGLVFYRMLTGVLPFQADSAQEMMIKRLTDAPMPLASARPDIAYPPELQGVLDKALARSPADRYANAAQLGRDAEAAVGALALPGTRVAEPVTTAKTQLMDAGAAVPAARRRAPPASAAAPARKRFPVMAVLGGIGGVGVLAVVGYLAMGGSLRLPLGAAADSTHASDSTALAAAPTGGRETAGAAAKNGGGSTAPHEASPKSTPLGKESPPPRPPEREPTHGPSLAELVADSLRVGIRRVDDESWDAARGALMFVFNSAAASRAQRGEAAYNIASTFGNVTDSVVRWLRTSNGLGFSGAAAALHNLGVSP
jgi:hypothetical protein